MTQRLLAILLPAVGLLFSACSWVDKGVGSNIPPRSADDAYEVSEGGVLELQGYADGVLGNDKDGGNRQLTARLVEGKAPLYAAEDGFSFNSDGTFTYIHNGEEPPAAVEINGVVRHCDFFTYIANDGIDDGEPKDVCIDIKPVNDPPVIKAQRPISTKEDTPITITPNNLVVEDPDNGPEELRILIKEGEHYRLEQDTVYPANEFSGDLSVALVVSDGKAVSEPFIVTVNVISVNDPTEIQQKENPIVIAEDTAREITFDDLVVIDPDNDYPADFTLVVNDVDGNHYRVDPPGSNQIRPDPNYYGPLSVGITLIDKEGQPTGKTLAFQVTPVNDPPKARGATIEVREGGEYKSEAPGLLTADKASDVDGDELSLDTTPVTPPRHGSLTLNADGSWQYKHDGSETTRDRFTYRILDGQGGEDTATVVINIKLINDPPVAAGDSAETNEDTPVTTGNVLANDNDPDGDTLVITGVDAKSARGGAVKNNGNGTFTYTPPANFNGRDSFTYTVSDGKGGTAKGTVTITVKPVNDPPIARTDNATTNEDTPVTTGNVLANDVDPDGDPLAIAAVDARSARGGAVKNNGNGTFTYTPPANFNGRDSFTYTVSDGKGGTAKGTVTVTVRPINDPPVAQPDSATTDEDTPVTIPVLANDSDPDGDPLTIAAVDARSVQGGVVQDSGGGNLTYAPPVNFHGRDSFTYTVSDGKGGTAKGTVTVTVRPINDPPVAQPDSATTAVGAPVTIPVLANDSDPDGDTLTITAVDARSAHNGVVVIAGKGSVGYTPAVNFDGVDTFTYTVSDGKGGTAKGTVTVTVAPTGQNRAPTISGNPPTTVAAGSPYSFTPTASDPDTGDTLTFTITNKPGWAVFDGATGALSGTPTRAHVGTTTGIVITVTDKAGASASLPAFDLTVTGGTNRPPVAQPDSATTDEGAPVAIPVLANDSDPDGDTLTITAVDARSAHNGVVVIAGKGSVGYTPAVNFNGVDTFTYTVSDGKGGTAKGTVTVTVAPTGQNRAPTISGNPPTTVAAGSPYSFTPTASDPDTGDRLAFTITNKPGWAVFDGATGALSGTPTRAHVGTTTGIVITVTDKAGASASLPAFDLTVTGGTNRPPVAQPDSATTDEDKPATIPVLANDSDPDDDTLTINAVDAVSAQNGTVKNNGNGTITYTPAANFNGSDSFTYTVSDGKGNSAQGTVTITVKPVNDPPNVPAGQVFEIEENKPNAPVKPGPVQASDVENGTLTYAIEGANPGNFVIDPATGQISTTVGLDHDTPPVQYVLTIKVTDNGTPAASTTQNVRINIKDVEGAAATLNQPPQVNAVCRNLLPDTVARNIPLKATDPDGDDRALRFYLQSAPRKGVATVDVTGRFTYSPHSGARGSDSFTYRVVDQRDGEAIGVVRIIIGKTRIMPVGDAITAGSTDGLNVTPGYRRSLRQALEQKGYAVEFVGSQSVAPDRHEGHLGEQVTTAYVAANIEGWLTDNPADIVLLHIGTQDFVTGGDAVNSEARVGDILAAIDAWADARNQQVTVFLAKIVGQTNDNPALMRFNKRLAERAEAGKVILVDQYNALDYPADLADGLHPNSSGYGKMARRWQEALEREALERCP